MSNKTLSVKISLPQKEVLTYDRQRKDWVPAHHVVRR